MSTFIPDIVETAGPQSWRIADGKISRGREADGTIEHKEAIVGYLRRVGIHEGETDAGDPYAKLEADIETNDGILSVSTPLLNATSGKPTFSSCISFAEGLLDCEPGQLIQIKAGQSSKPNKYGKHSTYANIYHVQQMPSGKWTARQTKKFPWVGDMPEYGEELLNALVENIKKHACFAPRPKRKDDAEEGAPWDAFVEAIESADWPSLWEGKAHYLAIASKAAKEEFGAIEDVPEAVWNGMAEQVMAGTKMPKALAELAKPKPLPPAGEEYDPFADE